MVVVVLCLGCNLLAEWLAWVCVYRTQRYRELLEKLEKKRAAVAKVRHTALIYYGKKLRCKIF